MHAPYCSGAHGCRQAICPCLLATHLHVCRSNAQALGGQAPAPHKLHSYASAGGLAKVAKTNGCAAIRRRRHAVGWCAPQHGQQLRLWPPRQERSAAQLPLRQGLEAGTAWDQLEWLYRP